ncbi:MAG: ROK family protein, partial [Chthoniobacteraceae bacterium]
IIPPVRVVSAPPRWMLDVERWMLDVSFLMNFLAVEIGGTKLQLCIGTSAGEILERRRFQIDRAEGGQGIRRQIEGALPELLEKYSPRAIGVGFGGPVDWQSGKIARSHHLEGWNDYPLGDWFETRAGLPTFIDNDANVAALAEARLGAGRGSNPVFYVTLGSGVGGGLVHDGRIFHGAPPGEVEIGHLRLDREGTIVEDRCSGWNVDRRVQREAAAHPESMLADLVRQSPTGGEARHLRVALAHNDPVAETILRETMENLAFGLSHVVHLFHPQTVVVGGGLSLLGPPLQTQLAKALPAFLMDSFLPGPRIEFAALGEDTVPVGALVLAADRLIV